jgi:hypothetical protein
MEDLALSQYEHTIASEVIAPEDIRVSFSGVLHRSFNPTHSLHTLRTHGNLCRYEPVRPLS